MADQLTEDDLKDMSAEEIVSAKREGRLNAILGRPVATGEALDVIEREAAQ